MQGMCFAETESGKQREYSKLCKLAAKKSNDP